MFDSHMFLQCVCAGMQAVAFLLGQSQLGEPAWRVGSLVPQLTWSWADERFLSRMRSQMSHQGKPGSLRLAVPRAACPVADWLLGLLRIDVHARDVVQQVFDEPVRAVRAVVPAAH